MTNKQTQSLFKKNTNLCETNREYPLFNRSTISRHLFTGDDKSGKLPERTSIEKLVNQMTTEQQTKDSNKQSKHIQERTEVIDLFQFKQEEELKNKSYRKRRYERRTDRDDDERDNSN